MKSLPVLSTLIVLIGSAPVHAEQRAPLPSNPRYSVSKVGAEAGLSTRLVATLAIDDHGFIWFGTLDGLFRFDGATAERFGKQHGLPSPYIEQLVVSRSGTLWASTHGGVARFDGLAFEQLVTGVEQEFSLRNAMTPQHIAASEEEHLYVASNSGLLEFDGRTLAQLRTWTTADGLPANRITAVTVAPDGAVWAGSDGAVTVLSPQTGSVSTFDGASGVPDELIMAVIVNRSGTVWLRSKHHLVRKLAGEARFVHDDQPIPPIAVEWGVPSLDGKGNPLVPTTKGLFFKVDGEWRSIGERQGLSSDMVLSALEDDSGALWIGLGGAGVNRWPGRKRWAAWTTAEGIPDNIVWNTLVDRRGRTWVATNKGVGIWDPAAERWHVRQEEDGVVGSRISKLVEDHEGWIWAFATRYGMTRFDPETLAASPIEMPKDCARKRFWVTTDPDGEIWIACSGYLLSVATAGGEASFEEVAVPDHAKECTRNMVFAPDGVLWTTGPMGVCRSEGGSWRRFSAADGLRLDFADELAAISGDEVWFGYHDFAGVTRMVLDDPAPPSVVHFGAEQGLPSDTVYLVDSDARGNIWAGGNAGLARISRDGLEVRIFDHRDGLIWDDVSGNSLVALEDGAFFLGTSRGLAHYTPQADEVVSGPPNVVITSATLGDEQVLLTDHPSVAHDRGTFTARFSGLTFSRPFELSFRYRLSGLETDFVETATREVRYPSLSAGTYLFEVYCVSPTGGQSAEPARYAFTVLPPLWETAWFRVLVALAFVGLFLAAVGLRTRKLRRDRDRLEAAVAERSAELAEANRQLKELSFTDALTKTRNRHYFSEVVVDDLARTLRRFADGSRTDPQLNISMIVYMIDLDFFKQVNDNHGHAIGDQVLADFSGRLRSVVRRSDLIVRWGGEEFLLLCRDANREQASAQAERILTEIGGSDFRIDDAGFRLTCSVGWAPFPFYVERPDAISIEGVIELADRGLYAAKAGGRNRACGVLPSGEPPSPADPDSDKRSIIPPVLDAPLDDLAGDLLELVHTVGAGPPSKPPLTPTAQTEGPNR